MNAAPSHASRLPRFGRCLLLAFALAAPPAARAQSPNPIQAGSLDPGFDPTAALDLAAGDESSVDAILPQGDGRVVVRLRVRRGGVTTRDELRRLNADGSLAPGAVFSLGDGTPFVNLAVQGDGAVLVGREFYAAGSPRPARAEVIRLLPDLRPDESFQASAGPADGFVLSALTLGGGGRVLVGGYLDTSDGPGAEQVLRLQPDGSPDATFRADLPGDGRFLDGIALQADGRVLLRGFFGGTGALDDQIVALRRNADGSADGGFRPTVLTGSKAGGPSLDLLLPLPDGGILLGGDYQAVNNESRYGAATRLNADGSVDLTFTPSLNARVGAAAADGKLILATQGLRNYAEATVVRLNADGSPDVGFNAGQGLGYPGIRAQVVQPDGKIIVGGGFTSFNGVARPAVARFNADGSLDESFFADLTGSPSYFGGVASLALQADGGIVLGGDLRHVNGEVHVGAVRLRADGSVDSGFRADVGDNEYVAVTQVLALPDGGIVLAGRFTTVNGVPRVNLARLRADGSVDPGFDAAVGAGFTIYDGTTVFAQPDGRLLATGNFPGPDGVPAPALVRLNADGRRDAAYNPNGDGSLGYTPLLDAVQPDGKVIVSAYAPRGDDSGGSGRRPVRLNVDGSVDPSFRVRPGQLPDNTGAGTPYFGQVSLLPDGGLLVPVQVNADNSEGRSITRLRRLNPDGSLDPAFRVESSSAGVSVTVQADGRLVVAGSLPELARYRADGQPDPGFVFRQGVEGSVNQVAVQADGNVLIGGDFPRVQGVTRPGLARLLGTAPAGAPARPTVGVTVDRPTVSRGAGETATVTFTRTGDDRSRTVRVVYRLSGLVNGTDYAGLPVVKKLKAGRDSASVTVRALPGGGDGKVKLTLLRGVGYEVSAAAPRVKVKVTD